jgi:hypothetical protein
MHSIKHLIYLSNSSVSVVLSPPFEITIVKSSVSTNGTLSRQLKLVLDGWTNFNGDFFFRILQQILYKTWRADFRFSFLSFSSLCIKYHAFFNEIMYMFIYIC